jgi:TFIIF-interacting CTD phosphatase-like protein
LIKIGAVKDKINLILDIDSTILHAITDYESKSSRDSISKLISTGHAYLITFKMGKNVCKLTLIKRPYLDDFLENVSKFCNVYVSITDFTKVDLHKW